MLFNYTYHIFCCQNQREPENPKGCCHEKGSEPVLDFFKKTVHDHSLKDTVRVSKSGCLAACRFGPSVVVYPEGIWYTVSSVEDARVIFDQHIMNGKPVKRLFMRQDNIEEKKTKDK